MQTDARASFRQFSSLEGMEPRKLRRVFLPEQIRAFRENLRAFETSEHSDISGRASRLAATLEKSLAR